jgi:hypothetical protein
MQGFNSTLYDRFNWVGNTMRRTDRSVGVALCAYNGWTTPRYHLECKNKEKTNDDRQPKPQV